MAFFLGGGGSGGFFFFTLINFFKVIFNLLCATLGRFGRYWGEGLPSTREESDGIFVKEFTNNAVLIRLF